MELRPLTEEDQETIEQVAALLVEAFPQAWPDLPSARTEVRESLATERLSLVAVEGAEVWGWIGGIPEYDGNVWEMHPLVVHTARRRHGVGRTLVVALEEAVRIRGGHIVLLGTDDEHGQTSLAGVDLFPDPWPHIARIQNLHRHPFEFYQRLGYSIVGVVPDANGPGKPDIMMAKRLG